jgi:hypothetical protein
LKVAVEKRPKTENQIVAELRSAIWLKEQCHSFSGVLHHYLKLKPESHKIEKVEYNPVF